MNFETFWASFPRKVAKGAALKAWNKLNPDAATTTAILQAVEAQKRHRNRVEATNDRLPKYKQTFMPDWKHPATWLNQQCWLDEVPAEVAEIKRDDMKKICAECRKEFQYLYPVAGRLYCLKCYDRKAHPELVRA